MPERSTVPPELTEVFASRWGLIGVLILAALVYHKPILAALQRSTRDPLVEALAEQNRHFSANNTLFLNLGPQLKALDENTARGADAAELVADRLAELLAVQRSIEKELIRRGRA